MNRVQSIGLLLAGGILLSIPGCADDPVMPLRDADGVRVVDRETGAAFDALTWNRPVRHVVSAHGELDDGGGTIRLRRLGVTLRIPEGAVLVSGAAPARNGRADPGEGTAGQDLVVTVRAHEGGAVSLGFAPHGIRFRSPARLEIDAERISPAGDDSSLHDLVAAYYEGEPSGTVEAEELIPVRVEDGTLIVELRHFSGYLLASG